MTSFQRASFLTLSIGGVEFSMEQNNRSDGGKIYTDEYHTSHNRDTSAKNQVDSVHFLCLKPDK